MNKVVRIDPNGSPNSSDQPMHVKKSTHDTIAWTAVGGGGPWVITFTNGTPISVTSVPVAKGSASNRYPIIGAVKDYPYTIAAAGSGGGGQDPDIIVDD